MKKLALFAACLLALNVAAKVKLSVTTTAGEHRANIGDKIKFIISLADKKDAGKKINAEVIGNVDIAKKMVVTADKEGKAEVIVPALRPGFVYLRVQCADSNIRVCGVAVEPEKIQPGLPEPADFKAYWDNIKKKIDNTPMEIVMTPWETQDKRVTGYRIKFPLGGKGKDAYGTLCFPKGAKRRSLPAMLRLYSAGSDWAVMEEKIAMSHGGIIVLALNPIPVENYTHRSKFVRKGGEFHGYSGWGITHRDTTFFNGMFQRLYRALNYLKSRPEWDGRILIVRGESQGGGQALAAAGLDPQVTCCAAYVPGINNHGAIVKGGTPGWPHFYRRKAFAENPQAVLKATSYIDTVNFSRYSKADTFVTVGFADLVAPAEGIYAAYNMLSGKKVILTALTAGHTMPKHFAEEREKFIGEHIKKMKKLSK